MDLPKDSSDLNSALCSQRTESPRSLAGERVLVVGLGRFGGGVGVTRWLAGRGAHVTVTDVAPREALAESVEAIAGLDVLLHLGGHDPRDLDATDLVVVNPAVNKSRSEFFQLITRRGIPWTTEMNLFCERCPARVIGVTGTYGKSTTCVMLADTLNACLRQGGAAYTGVHLGGNIGRSLLTELVGIRPTDLVVLEMSNSQLEDLPRIRWAPGVAVITNLFPHHLDRYGTYSGYVAAKLNILGGPENAGKIVLGNLDAEAERMLLEAISNTTRLRRVRRACSPLELLVPGDHNQANAACVLTVCDYLGLDEKVVRAALRTFRGLPHRIQHVGKFGGVDYYNDSKATSPDATVTAIKALDRTLVAIVGGLKKEVSLAACADAILRACRVVICTGESGPAFARAIRAAEGRRQPSAVREVTELEAAVRIAQSEAQPGDAVLFSPGAPSFDAYANYEKRGEAFADAVNAMS